MATPRPTRQRLAVEEVLAASADHPTAAEGFDRVRSRLPGIGAATVYRSLSLLVEAGRALELRLGGTHGAARYDARTDRHDHLVRHVAGAVGVQFLRGQRVISLVAAPRIAFFKGLFHLVQVFDVVV